MDAIATCDLYLALRHSQISLNLTRRYFWGSWKINNFNAVFDEIIEFTPPIITHNKRVNMVLTNIVPLLRP